jgi:hypothetical protein
LLILTTGTISAEKNMKDLFEFALVYETGVSGIQKVNSGSQKYELCRQPAKHGGVG